MDLYDYIYYHGCHGSCPCVGDSLVITVSSQVAKLHSIQHGDTTEISPIGMGEFKIKKV